MANEITPQTVNQLNSANNILVVVSSGSDLDSIAAGLALKEFLKKSGKQCRVVSPTPLVAKLNFLPTVTEILHEDQIRKTSVVEVTLAHTELAEVSYQKQDQVLKIYLSPKSGQFEAQDIAVKTSVYPFDLIVSLGVSNLESLGEFYSKHAELFFQTPIINIDYKSSNENYGQINWVNLIHSAVSESTFDLLENLDPNGIDETIATLLLAGLIYQTNSFQTQKTSPQVFVKASKLVNYGAKQQEIISQLYRSKSFGLLHLWGRVLARLKQDLQNPLVYSAISQQDIERSNAQSSDVDEIIYEMTQQLSFAKHFLFFVEKDAQSTGVYAVASNPLDLFSLFAAYHPQSQPQNVAKFTVPKPLAAVESEIVTAVRLELAKYQG
ncbi:MAG: hypothetical protein KW788_02355 [Candidatus Doudnabacteria bacterium]|nr:hypothetical protein [Candidatus Doudnabacteria bacterium]